MTAFDSLNRAGVDIWFDRDGTDVNITTNLDEPEARIGVHYEEIPAIISDLMDAYSLRGWGLPEADHPPADGAGDPMSVEEEVTGIRSISYFEPDPVYDEYRWSEIPADNVGAFLHLKLPLAADPGEQLRLTQAMLRRMEDLVYRLSTKVVADGEAQ